MPRSTNAPASRKRRKRILERAKGFQGNRSSNVRKAQEAILHAMANSTAHRRAKKRDYRGLWITRVSAACRLNDISYSRFIEGLAKHGIGLNRKMLSEIAIHDPDGFASLVTKVKPAAGLPARPAA
jgi:large subunit ribosomal protein L20